MSSLISAHSMGFFFVNCVSADGSGKYFETVEHIAVTAKATSKVVCAISAACVCTYRVCCDVFGIQIEAKSRESPFYEVSCFLFQKEGLLQVSNLQPLVSKAFNHSIFYISNQFFYTCFVQIC